MIHLHHLHSSKIKKEGVLGSFQGVAMQFQGVLGECYSDAIQLLGCPGWLLFSYSCVLGGYVFAR